MQNTYIDDTMEEIERLLSNRPAKAVPHKLFIIVNNSPEKLMAFIWTLEKAISKMLGRKVAYEKIFEPLKERYVPVTYALTDRRLRQVVGFKPSTSIEEGLQRFANWYVEYYEVK